MRCYPPTFHPIHKWELEDKRTLILNLKEIFCSQPGRFGQTEMSHIATISDGTNTVDFTKASGKVKLADGRIAFVSDDNYLQIIGSTSKSYELGITSYES